jgi:hypothetical protein
VRLYCSVMLAALAAIGLCEAAVANEGAFVQVDNGQVHRFVISGSNLDQTTDLGLQGPGGITFGGTNDGKVFVGAGGGLNVEGTGPGGGSLVINPGNPTGKCANLGCPPP